MASSKRNLIQHLINNDIIKFGSFELKSGDSSPFYIDLRLVPSYPDLFQESVDLYLNVLHDNDLKPSLLAGLISAGVPFATAISLKESIPLLQIRSESKSHGRKRLIEGFYQSDQSVVLIDDLISTGASKIPAIDAIREAKLKVEAIIVLIDRRSLATIGTPISNVPVLSSFTLEDILELIEQLTFPNINQSEVIESLRKWLQDS